MMKALIEAAGEPRQGHRPLPTERSASLAADRFLDLGQSPRHDSLSRHGLGVTASSRTTSDHPADPHMTLCDH